MNLLAILLSKLVYISNKILLGRYSRNIQKLKSIKIPPAVKASYVLQTISVYSLYPYFTIDLIRRLLLICSILKINLLKHLASKRHYHKIDQCFQKNTFILLIFQHLVNRITVQRKLNRSISISQNAGSHYLHLKKVSPLTKPSFSGKVA